MVRGCSFGSVEVCVCVCVYQILALFSSLLAAVTLAVHINALSIELKCTSKGATCNLN